ncbi:MAG TPA: acyltransferase [Geothrix sp.]|nr:acyltransferase [Geothrix sp.]
MGILRLLLALWVVAMHGRGFLGLEVTQAWVAVQCFFIISGFYITLILNEKYTGPGSTRLFLSQRFLRLLPVYWAVLLLTLAASGLAWGWWGHALPPLQTWLDHHPSMHGGAKAFLASANVLLFGQAEALFLGLDPAAGTLYWTTDFSVSEPMVWHFLAVPQAWSIELELLFYALAPWIVRRPLPVVLGVLGASFAARLACYTVFGLRTDPWTYRFFPNELGMFLLGAVAYALYRSPWRARAAEGLWIWGLFACFFAFTLAFPFIPLRGQLKAWPYFALATLTIPFLFAETRNLRWDRWIGELSYPVYLIHFLVIWICEAALPPAAQKNLGLWAIIGSIAVSIVLLRTLLEPFERWRARRAPRLLA